MVEKRYTKEQAAAMKNIALILKTRQQSNLKLNRYEYYLLGGISFRKATVLIYDMYCDRALSAGEYYRLNYYIEKELLFGASRNKELIMSTYYQFGDRVITDNEKEMIRNKLIALGLGEKDIDDLVFSAAVREYAIEQGLIKTKKLKK